MKLALASLPSIILLVFIWLSGNWVLNDREICGSLTMDLSKMAPREPDQPQQHFKMSKMYKYTREDIQKFYRQYVYALVFSVLPSIITTLCLLHSDSL